MACHVLVVVERWSSNKSLYKTFCLTPERVLNEILFKKDPWINFMIITIISNSKWPHVTWNTVYDLKGLWINIHFFLKKTRDYTSRDLVSCTFLLQYVKWTSFSCTLLGLMLLDATVVKWFWFMNSFTATNFQSKLMSRRIFSKCRGGPPKARVYAYSNL